MGLREKQRLPRLVSNPVFLVASAALIATLTAVLMKPPSFRDEYVPDDQFSAIRALVILEDLLAESEPHVTGSALNREIRNRITGQFEQLGYQPEVQESFHCHPHFGSCANIENIIAIRPGSEGRNAVLVTAHYDSSWAGPGAGDDGAGVATLIEMARMLSGLGQLRNDVVFLITDAEEQGLIGAHAFAEQHPLFSRVKAVINIEARGVTGPSMMFETGDGNRSLIRILSKSLDRPVANSLSYEVYKRMPNDTDYSVYRNRGVMGVNFAFSRGVALYHSRLDDTQHLDPDSVQHQGDNAWSMLLALADRDITRLQSREDAAYIDVFGRVLWHYPLSSASGVTLVLTVLILLGIVLAHKRQISASGIVFAVIAQIMALLLLAGGAWLLNWPLGELADTNPIEHPFPWVAQFSIFVLCVLVIWLAGKLLAHRVSHGDGMLVAWLTFAGLALYLDFNLPAASFLALFPMTAFFIGMLIDAMRFRSRNGLLIASVLGFWMASYLAAYYVLLLGTIISFEYTHVMVVPLALPLLLVIPLWFSRTTDPVPGWWPGLFALGLVIASSIYHQFLPGFSQERPRGMNLVYRQMTDDSGSYLFLESPGSVDKTYVESVSMEPGPVPANYSSMELPLDPEMPSLTRYRTMVDSLDLPGAVVEELRIDKSSEADASVPTLEFKVSSPVESERLVIAFPLATKIDKARVNGVLAIDGQAETKRGVTPTYLALPFPGPGPVSVEVQFENQPPEGFNLYTRLPLPDSIWQEYGYTWPDDAQPIFHGFRAEVVQGIMIAED